MMSDSGIVIDMDSVEKVVVDPDHLSDLSTSFKGQIYKLKSTQPVLKSEPASVKQLPASSMNIQMRQMLMRQQHEEQMKLARNKATKVTVVKVPTTPVSASPKPIGVQTLVPQNIVEYKQGLQHPTKFHIRATCERQVNEYLSKTPEQRHVAQSLPVHPSSSLPSPVGYSTSLPVNEPESPMSQITSYTDSISELDDILGEFGLDSVSSSVDLPPAALTGIPPATLPEPLNVFELAPGPAAGSCPAGFIKDEPTDTKDSVPTWIKDRQKKDNHNMIERRRRYNINDRIIELGTLLPKTQELEHRQNKGTILKESVSYIRRLQKDQHRLRSMEQRQKNLESVNRKMLLRIQELEQTLQRNGLPPDGGADSSQLLACVLGVDAENGVTLTPASSSRASSVSSLQHQAHLPDPAAAVHVETAVEAMMEDSPLSALTEDPMLSEVMTQQASLENQQAASHIDLLQYLNC